MAERGILKPIVRNPSGIGGWASFTVPGRVQTGSDIAYPIVIAAGVLIDHMQAVVNVAPTGASMQGQLLRDGSPWGDVFTIPAGDTDSGSFAPGAQDSNQHTYTLQVTQVGSTEPGRDLTVYIF